MLVHQISHVSRRVQELWPSKYVMVVGRDYNAPYGALPFRLDQITAGKVTHDLGTNVRRTLTAACHAKPMCPLCGIVTFHELGGEVRCTQKNTQRASRASSGPPEQELLVPQGCSMLATARVTLTISYMQPRQPAGFSCLLPRSYGHQHLSS